MKTKIIISLSILLIAYFGYSFIQLKNAKDSDAFKFANLHLKMNSNFLNGIVGDQLSSDLSFWGYSFSKSGGREYAAFKFKVKGSIKNAFVYISVTKEAGDWKIQNFDVAHSS